MIMITQDIHSVDSDCAIHLSHRSNPLIDKHPFQKSLEVELLQSQHWHITPRSHETSKRDYSVGAVYIS